MIFWKTSVRRRSSSRYFLSRLVAASFSFVRKVKKTFERCTSTKKYSSISFTKHSSGIMTVPSMFADFVQAAAISFTCADECEALVFEGKQFYRAFQRASITIKSAGDVTFEGDAFSYFTNTGDIVISAAGSLMFNGEFAFSYLAKWQSTILGVTSNGWQNMSLVGTNTRTSLCP